jgi:hypothetical protein
MAFATILDREFDWLDRAILAIVRFFGGGEGDDRGSGRRWL